MAGNGRGGGGTCGCGGGGGGTCGCGRGHGGGVVVDGALIPDGPVDGSRPLRSVAASSWPEPRPMDVDLVDEGLSSLGAGPVNLVDANMTPRGLARPVSMWNSLNYGSQ